MEFSAVARFYGVCFGQIMSLLTYLTQYRKNRPERNKYFNVPGLMSNWETGVEANEQSGVQEEVRT